EPGDDRLAVLWMLADLARQRQQLQRGVQRDLLRAHALRDRGSLRLLSVAAGAELDIVAVGPLAHAHRQAARGVLAKLARLQQLAAALAVVVGGLEGERPRHPAVRIIGAADEGAEAAELDAEPAVAAGGTRARILAAAVRREEVRAQRLVERGHHLLALEVLGAGDRSREVAPERGQHGAPLSASPGDLVELVLE